MRSLPVPVQEAKSETVSQQRMALLMPRSSAAAAARPRADVVIHVKTSTGYKEVRTVPEEGGLLPVLEPLWMQTLTVCVADLCPVCRWLQPATWMRCRSCASSAAARQAAAVGSWIGVGERQLAGLPEKHGVLEAAAFAGWDGAVSP